MKLFKILNSKISKYLFHFAIKSNDKKFEILFNLFSFLNSSSNRVYFKDDYFYNTEVDWRFFHKKQGLMAYGKGFKKRKESLISSYLTKNIQFEDRDIVIDVGANNGDFFLCFDKKIQYYAYEPSPIVFSNLEYNVKNQNLYNLGISNIESNNVEFNLKDEFGDSSILPIKDFTKKISIRTTTLDNEIGKIKKKIKLIKLEAEGYEPEILLGLKKHLSDVEYITIDCGFERGEMNESTICDCVNYLLKNNFAMVDFGYPRIVCLFKNLSI